MKSKLALVDEVTKNKHDEEVPEDYAEVIDMVRDAGDIELPMSELYYAKLHNRIMAAVDRVSGANEEAIVFQQTKQKKVARRYKFNSKNGVTQ